MLQRRINKTEVDKLSKGPSELPVREASNEFTRAETVTPHMIDSRSSTPPNHGMDKEVDKPIEYE